MKAIFKPAACLLTLGMMAIPALGAVGAEPPVSEEVFYYDHKKDRIFQLTENDTFDSGHDINGRGDVVWYGWDGSDYEIYLYKHRHDRVEQITDNDYDDRYPVMNDMADIAWVGMPEEEGEIFLYHYRKRRIIRLTTNDIEDGDDGNVRINNRGDVAWSGGSYDMADIFLYDHKIRAVDKLTDNDFGVHEVCLNRVGDVAWVGGRRDQSEIYLYLHKNGAVQQLTTNTADDGAPCLNDKGDVAWAGGNDVGGETVYDIYLYDRHRDEIIQISENGGNWRPKLNNKGDMVWSHRDTERNYLVYYSHRYQVPMVLLTYGVGEYSINRKGFVAFNSYLEGNNPTSEIFIYNPKRECIKRMTFNQYWDAGPKINDQGNIAWGGGFGP
jgi:Tol biopolymer transport system component